MDIEAKLMWCAGFFQGEGYVGCRKIGGALDIAITQYYDRTPLDRFAEYVEDGNVGGPYTNKYTNEVFQYRKTGVGAERIITKLMPYLSGKKLIQAETALRQVNERRELRGGFNKKPRLRGQKTHCINGHEFVEFGKLNSRGSWVCKPCHAKHKRTLRENKKNG